jgi:hypothetical protein
MEKIGSLIRKDAAPSMLAALLPVLPWLLLFEMHAHGVNIFLTLTTYMTAVIAMGVPLLRTGHLYGKCDWHEVTTIPKGVDSALELLALAALLFGPAWLFIANVTAQLSLEVCVAYRARHYTPSGTTGEGHETNPTF